jgi:hypothetical protein
LKLRDIGYLDFNRGLVFSQINNIIATQIVTVISNKIKC